jgi:hypothetical protein
LGVIDIMQRAAKLARMSLLTCIAGASLSACANTAIVHYVQPANCHVITYESSPGVTQSKTAGAGIFSVYKITTIENNASGAANFAFDPNKLYAKGGNSTTFGSTVNTVKPTTVLKGQTAQGLGKIVLTVPSATWESEKTDQTDLLYKSGSGESVLMVRDSGPAPQFLAPCTATAVANF